MPRCLPRADPVQDSFPATDEVSITFNNRHPIQSTAGRGPSDKILVEELQAILSLASSQSYRKSSTLFGNIRRGTERAHTAAKIRSETQTHALRLTYLGLVFRMRIASTLE